MKKLHYLSILLLVAFCSCGPNATELAAIQKHHDDSVANAVQLVMQKKQECQAKLSKLNDQLNTIQADLVVANDELNEIRQFHLLRTPSEREEQIKKQVLKIEQLKDRIAQVKNDIDANNSVMASLMN